MKYFDYKDMKEFYTIAEVCHLFEMEKHDLKHYAQKYDVKPVEDPLGNWGFLKRDVRKLHNILYKEQKGYKNNSDEGRKGNDPWA